MKNKDVIQLSDHFTLPRLMRFCLPSIVMMVFTSIYGVVDGYFVSNFVGTGRRRIHDRNRRQRAGRKVPR